MAKDRTWEEAIREVLASASGPLHYRDITDQILEKGLRKSVGATPSATVGATIYSSMKAPDSPYRQVEKGVFTLRDKPSRPSDADPDTDTEEDEDVVTATIPFGMFWERDKVDWKSKPRLRGVFQPRGGPSKSSDVPVDFSAQHGVYLLHDANEVIYVGRTTDLGKRLSEHTRDLLQARWNRFSWFGFRPVLESGNLGDKREALPKGYGMEKLIATMEVVLIEAFEPRQNRTAGDQKTIAAAEYRQDADPELEKKRKDELAAHLLLKLGK